MTAEPNDGKLDGHKTNIPEQANLETARADKRLKIQRAYLDTLLDCAPHAITLADRNHKLIRTNAHFTRMFGYTPEEVLGKTCDELIVSAEKLDEASEISSTVAQGLSAKIETVRHRKDGTPVFVELTATPVLIGNKHIGNYAGYRDITDLKLAEKRAASQSEFARQVLNSTDAHMAVVGPDGAILAFNTAWGRFAEENNGGPETFWGLGAYYFTQFSEDWGDVTNAEEAFDGLRKVQRGERNQFELDYPCHDPAGENRWFLMRVSPLEGREGAVLVSHIDITERRRVEEALRESESKLKAAFEGSHDAITLTGQDGKLLDCNRRALELFGLGSKEDFLDKRPADFSPEYQPDGRRSYEVSRELIGRVLRDHGFLRFEWLHRRKTGETFPTEVILTHIRLGDQDVLQASIRDITERKIAEEKFERSAALDSSLLELHTLSSAPESQILDFSLEAVLKTTRSVFSFLGLVDETESILTINRWSKEAMAQCAIEQKPIVYPVCEAGLWADCIRQRKPVLVNDYEDFSIGKKGTPRGHVPIKRFLSVPIFDNERIVAVGGVANKKEEYTDLDVIALSTLTTKMWDILNRKRTNEALRRSEHLLNEAQAISKIGGWEYDLPAKEITWTNEVYRIYGVDKIYNPIDIERDISFYGKEDRPTVRQAFRDSVTKGLAYDLELRFNAADGTKKWVRTIGKPVLEDGRIVKVIGNIIDVTEQKRAEEERLSLQEQLRQSQKVEAIGQLAGGIAHDFNNALTVILGNADMMLMDLNKENPLRGVVREIKKAGERASKLTQQLLAFGRKQILQPEVLNLNEVVLGMEKMLRRVIRENIELETNLAADIGPVEADPGQIEQVILNLAVNARDAMPTGGKLTIETKNVRLDKAYASGHVTMASGSYVMLAVSDTGTGMTKEVQQKIFEPFFTTKEKGKGTGLGLSTVYGIVRQSQGTVWVYSEPGKGTTFKVYLPRVKKGITSRKDVTGEIKIPSGSETILAVEDDGLVRDVASRFLSSGGYNVLVAENGDEALRICREHQGPIHLLLTDMVMPGLGGKEIAERAKELRPELKVLFMSGYTDHAIVRNGILEEGIAFIQKPFTRQGLAWKVRGVLDE
ncbi:MAG: PAS domain S-box protein [Desulfatiglandales bacterium]